MLDKSIMLTSFFAFALALALSFGATPLVRRLAKKIGAVDVPKDGRRMHKVPIPRIGGLAIFGGFLVSTLIFVPLDGENKAILIGALLIVALGVVDDIVALKASVKLAGQLAAALIPAFSGVVIARFGNPFAAGEYINLGVFAIPVTVIWIVGMTNAVNFIDGLDGLACGISSIACITMFTIAILLREPDITVLMAALAGGCLGFLPFNMNPAKIFMGDTGAMFLGYIFATVSVQGLFKFYAVISFAVPFIMLGLPIFDMLFAIVRRVLRGQSPMHADRGHLHHKLIDMGFDQKQSVAILYVLSLVLGMAAVILTASGETMVIFLVLAILISFLIGMTVMTHERRAAAEKEKKEQKEQEKERENTEERETDDE